MQNTAIAELLPVARRDNPKILPRVTSSTSCNFWYRVCCERDLGWLWPSSCTWVLWHPVHIHTNFSKATGTSTYSKIFSFTVFLLSVVVGTPCCSEGAGAEPNSASISMRQRCKWKCAHSTNEQTKAIASLRESSQNLVFAIPWESSFGADGDGGMVTLWKREKPIGKGCLWPRAMYKE